MTLQVSRSILLLASAFLCGTAVHASVIYDESVSGDLSNSGLTPTLLTVSLGSNELFRTTGKTTAIDRDYFTFIVPKGLVLSAITLLPGTKTLGPLGDSFIGVEAGPKVTVATSAKTAAGLLGWDHYDTGDIGTDILPSMGSAGLGSTGFTAPLPSGTYSFWVQEANVGTVPYGLDFTIATPEPGSWGTLLVGLVLLVAYTVRKKTVSARAT